MISTKLAFPNQNGQSLAARLDLPVDQHPQAYALFAHCFTCSKNLKAIGNISRALTRERIAVLRFDFTGLGESEGDFAQTNFSSNVDDLVAAAQFLEKEYQAPSLVIGHSLGGAAILQASHQIPSALAVATINAPADPEHVTHLVESSREEIEEKGEARVTLAGRSFCIKDQFLKDLEKNNMEKTIRNLRKALLVCHAPRDTIVGIDNAATIYQLARHPKSFLSLDDADHLLSAETDSLYVGGVIAAWVRKYIPALEEAEEEKISPPGGQVYVRTGKEAYRTEVIAGGHSLVADEPKKLGGTDLGPTPYDLLLAALGSCTSITLRMYADRKGWPVDAIGVALTHRRLHASDCEDCEAGGGKLDRIERQISLEGDLSEKERERMLEIADKCPVHKTLHAGVTVTSRLIEDEQ